MVEKEKTVGVLVNMPKSLRDDFKKILDKQGSSMNAVIRILIAEYVTKMEQLEDKPKRVIKRKQKSGE